VISAGVIMNMLFAFASYAFVAGALRGSGLRDHPGRTRSSRRACRPVRSPSVRSSPGAGSSGSATRREHWGDLQRGSSAPSGTAHDRARPTSRDVEIEVPAGEEARRASSGRRPVGRGRCRRGDDSRVTRRGGRPAAGRPHRGRRRASPSRTGGTFVAADRERAGRARGDRSSRGRTASWSGR
jgi:hypothetical protein